MTERVWIPAALFVLTLGCAMLLAGAVLITPWIAGENAAHPLVALYAQDTTVRRTSLVAALGLTVTAFVFFRPKGWLAKKEIKPDTTSDVAGA